MITSIAIRTALEGMSLEDRQLLDPARWARDAEEIDDDIRSVFTAPAFLELRMSEPGGIVNLLDDYGILAEERQNSEDFRLIGNALRLSASILTRDPGQLATQLLARLPASYEGPIRDLRANLAAEYSRALKPVRTTLTSAAQAFRVREISDAGLTALACAANGKLAALDAHGRVHFVVLSENRLDVVATLHCPQASTLAFTPTGDRLLVGARDGQLTFVNAKSLMKAGERQLRHEIHELLCLDEKRAVVMHEEGASIVGLADGRELAHLGAEEGADCFTAIAATQEAELVYTGGVEGRIDMWSAADGRFVGRVGWFGEFTEERTSRAWAIMGVLTRSRSWGTGRDGTERLDFEAIVNEMTEITPEERAALRRHLREDPHRNTVTTVLPAGNGRTVVAACISGELRAWDTATGKRLGSLEGHGRGVASMALNSDGDRLISTGDRTVRVWSLSRMAPLGELPTGPASRRRCAVCLTGGRSLQRVTTAR